jgi:hypothetical protein
MSESRRERSTATASVGVGITRTTVFNHRPINVGVQYYASLSRISELTAGSSSPHTSYVDG